MFIRRTLDIFCVNVHSIQPLCIYVPGPFCLYPTENDEKCFTCRFFVRYSPLFLFSAILAAKQYLRCVFLCVFLNKSHSICFSGSYRLLCYHKVNFNMHGNVRGHYMANYVSTSLCIIIEVLPAVKSAFSFTDTRTK